MVTVTLTFSSTAEAAEALQRLHGRPPKQITASATVTPEQPSPGVVVREPETDAAGVGERPAASESASPSNADMLTAIRATLVRAVQLRSGGDSTQYDAAKQIMNARGIDAASKITDDLVGPIYAEFCAASLI